VIAYFCNYKVKVVLGSQPTSWKSAAASELASATSERPPTTMTFRNRLTPQDVVYLPTEFFSLTPKLLYWEQEYQHKASQLYR